MSASRHSDEQRNRALTQRVWKNQLRPGGWGSARQNKIVTRVEMQRMSAATQSKHSKTEYTRILLNTRHSIKSPAFKSERRRRNRLTESDDRMVESNCLHIGFLLICNPWSKCSYMCEYDVTCILMTSHAACTLNYMAESSHFGLALYSRIDFWFSLWQNWCLRAHTGCL